MPPPRPVRPCFANKMPPFGYERPHFVKKYIVFVLVFLDFLQEMKGFDVFERKYLDYTKKGRF